MSDSRHQVNQLRKLNEALKNMNETVSRIVEQRKALSSVQSSLDTILGNLQDMNSLFPQTRKFLESKGLVSVRQLDRQGMDELHEYLQNVLAKLRPRLLH